MIPMMGCLIVLQAQILSEIQLTTHVFEFVFEFVFVETNQSFGSIANVIYVRETYCQRTVIDSMYTP